VPAALAQINWRANWRFQGVWEVSNGPNRRFPVFQNLGELAELDLLKKQIVIGYFRKREQELVALWRKKTCDLKHPMHLCHPVQGTI